MNEEDIRRRAYRIWQNKQRAGIPSSQEENWEEAEWELMEEQERKRQNGSLL